MAQTKRRRRTKHRGTPAGTIEARGRTGRKPTPQERRTDRAQARANRFDQPPTWRGAANRAALATILFFLVVVALFRQPIAAAVPIALFMFLVYIPLGYYTDQFLHRRRQQRKREGKG
jgi:hypothetical protein